MWNCCVTWWRKEGDHEDIRDCQSRTFLHLCPRPSPMRAPVVMGLIRLYELQRGSADKQFQSRLNRIWLRLHYVTVLHLRCYESRLVIVSSWVPTYEACWNHIRWDGSKLRHNYALLMLYNTTSYVLAQSHPIFLCSVLLNAYPMF